MVIINNVKTNKIKLISEISLLALSFILPFIILIIIFNVNHVSLGGYSNLTIMMIDMQSEYICYLRDLREILLNGGSLIYTTEKVFGGDYLSIFTFYLSSPFNLFVVFFKEEAIPLFFVWSSILKMAFAGLNCYLFLRFTSKFTYTKIIFSLGYALTSYSLIYISNYMWLDGVMILPLVTLGLHFLKEKKHYWLYPLAIAYSLMTSWYIGFMICMFAVVYFFYLFAVSFSTKNKEFISFSVRFAVFSLLGGLLSVTYWLVAFIHLSGTKGFSEVPPSKWFTFSMLISGFLENNYAQGDLIRQYNSYISMFVGIVPLVFAITFFFNKKYSLRERLALLVVIGLYLFMSSNTVTAALLHGGKEPTWFPGRYSFIISLIVCYIGSKSMDEAENLHPAWYTVPTLVGILSIVILLNTKHSDRLAKYPVSIPSLIMYFVTIFFAFIISLVHYLPKKSERFNKISSFIPYSLGLLLVVQIISVYRGSNNVVAINAKENQLQKYETYLSDCSYQESVNFIKKYEKQNDNSPFYRMEMTFNRPGNYNRIDNNPMFYSYAGLSNFSSSSKKEVEGYMSKIGFHYNGFFSKYQAGSTYAINSFLGIKYLIEDKTARYNFHPYFLDSDTFEKIDTGDSPIDFYKNNRALSLGFSSDKTDSYFVNEGVRAESGNVYWFDHFEYQNQIFKDIDQSINQNIFKPLEETSITCSPGLTYDEDEFGIRTYHKVYTTSHIEIKFQVPSEGYNMPLYFSEKDYKSDINYYIDGHRYEINTYWNKGIYSFPDTSSHTHTLRISFSKPMNDVTIRPELYYEDLAVLNQYLASGKNQEFILEKVNNKMTKKSFTGHIDITDNSKDLVFTLPNEEGIDVYVDGKKAKTFTRYNIFTAIDLSKYSTGTHKVTIEYKDKALVVAIPIFIVALLGFVPLVIYYDKIEDLFKKRLRKNK